MLDLEVLAAADVCNKHDTNNKGTSGPTAAVEVRAEDTVVAKVR